MADITHTCPHCGANLGSAGVRSANVDANPGNVLLVSCNACTKVLGVLPGELIPDNAR